MAAIRAACDSFGRGTPPCRSGGHRAAWPGGLGLRRNFVAVLALAENAVGSRAFKPKDVLRSLKGIEKVTFEAGEESD